MFTINAPFIAMLRKPAAYAIAMAICISSMHFEVFSQTRPGQRKINRPQVNQSVARQNAVKRAYVAGAVAERRRDNSHGYRNYDRGGYRPNYNNNYRNYNDDNSLAAGLVGAAIGAIAVGVIMNNKSEEK